MLLPRRAPTLAFDPIAARPAVHIRLSAVSDRRLLGDGDTEALQQLIPWSAALAGAGVDVLQIRERGLSDAVLVRLVRQVVDAVRGSALRVVVNDRVDVALAARAHGAHLSATAAPASTIRRLVPAGFVIGRSIHVGDDPAGLERDGGCDYLTFGTVFPSTSKPTGHRAAGVAALSRACVATRLPVFAIGGVTPENAAEVTQAGAAGISAISLFVEGWRTPGSEAVRAGRLAATVTTLRREVVAAGWSGAVREAER